MSYGQSAALQAAVYAHLAGDATLAGLVNGAIYDALPSGTLPTTYVTLGPEEAQARGDKTGSGALHRFGVTVTTSDAGFADAKTIAAGISDRLDGAKPALVRGAISFMRFRRAKAVRLGSGNQRQIELIFEARLDDS